MRKEEASRAQRRLSGLLHRTNNGKELSLLKGRAASPTIGT